MVLVASGVASLPAAAGTISLAWDPCPDEDLAGYRIYYGNSPGNYTQHVDVGNVTEHTLTGLTDCTTWHVAVKAVDTEGLESESYSNEVSGWPRPVVGNAVPAAAEQGRRLDVTITGTNFQGGASVEFSNAGIVVNSVSVNSCSELTADITVGGSASVGATDIDVVNPDNVFGTGAGLFTVQAAVAPTVESTTPVDGASGVSPDVQPRVDFSEAMLPESVTSTTVRLLDDGGTPVAQASGSPSLSSGGTVATIVPAAPLSLGQTYRIQVVGGASGVVDLANHPMDSTFTQGTGFSVEADDQPPVISDVTETGVTATRATITWTTDEDADSQVFYREEGQSAYQETSVDPALVTDHSVELMGLTPNTTYEYHVRSADGSGNASTSSPDQTFTTPDSSFSYIAIEAELGDLVVPVRQTSGAGAFGNAWIDTPTGGPDGTPSNPLGTATLGVNIPTAGTWYLWVRLLGPDLDSDSWFESIDGAARQAIFPDAWGTWEWIEGRSYTLTAGLHSVELGGREPGARADRILLTNDPDFVPTEQPNGDTAPPSAVTGFTAAPSDAQNHLEWTNPGDGDYARTVVRYRTDGRYPTSPEDGYAVADRPATPGSTDAYDHTGLTNGVTYHYSAFAIDTSGNVSEAAHADGTPAVTNQPPGQVENLTRTDKKNEA
jgi:hypothetical protein